MSAEKSSMATTGTRHPSSESETEDRVRRNTASHVKSQLDTQLEANVRHYQSQGPEAISQRIAELDREWPVDRALMTGAGVNVLLGLLLGRTVNRAWYVFPAVVAGFLIQHTIQGWCPPLPVFRRLGFRTGGEISREKFALKALRGDFRDVGGGTASSSESLERALAASV